MTDLPDLRISENHKAFDAHMAWLFRVQDLDAAEDLLDRGLRAKPSPFSEACRAVRADDVRIPGWDQVHALIVQLAQRGKPCTAYGIDLSPHSDTNEPMLECSYYDNSSFPFSTSSDDEILSAYGVEAPWMAPWQGCFLDCDTRLTVEGLAELHQLDKRTSHNAGGFISPRMMHYEGYLLGKWFLHLRLHQAVRRELAVHGMPQAMPVVVGENDFQPHVIAVYRAAKVVDYTVIGARRAAASEQHDLHTAKTIAEVQQRRSDYRALLPGEARDEFVAFFRLIERAQLESMQMSADVPTWEMPDEMFEEFVKRCYASRMMR